MKEVMKTNKADLGMYANMWAEQYDLRVWYEAREKHLQQKVWELEQKNEELEKKMKYLELNNCEVFDEVQKYGLDARCAECGTSTKGRKIRGLWDNILCEDCGEHTDDESEEEEGRSICPVCDFSYTEGMIEREEVVPCGRCYKCYHGDCGMTACECVFSDEE
jgi:hypothetical protein